MPRYVRKQTDESLKINVGNIVKAVKEIKMNKKSERAAALEYGITRSSLHNYKKRVEQRFPNFSEATDEQLANFIESTAGWATQTVSRNVFFLTGSH